MLFKFVIVLHEAMKVLLNIGSEVDIDDITISACTCLADSMYKLTDASNINQADDNKSFNEYNSDD